MLLHHPPTLVRRLEHETYSDSNLMQDTNRYFQKSTTKTRKWWKNFKINSLIQLPKVPGRVLLLVGHTISGLHPVDHPTNKSRLVRHPILGPHLVDHPTIAWRYSYITQRDVNRKESVSSNSNKLQSGLTSPRLA